MVNGARNGVLAMFVIGLMGLIGAIALFAHRLTGVLPPTHIRSCAISTAKYHHAIIVTVDGRRVDESAYHCPNAQIIEKRHGELRYRVDGEPLGSSSTTIIGPSVLAFLGALALVLGLLMWSAARRLEQA